MYRINVGPRRKNSRKIEKARSIPGFAQWVRGRPCFLANKGGCGFLPGRLKIEFAHADPAGGKGMGIKVADSKGLPLCPVHHSEQHGQIGAFRDRGGWETFQAKYEFDVVEVADAYWQRWPGRRAWEASRGE